MSDRYQVSELKHDKLCLIDTFKEDDEEVIITVEREAQARMLADLLNEKEDLINEKPLDLHKDFEEWDKYIDNIIIGEKNLITLKEEFEEQSQEIIANTDFKELYGANNQKVRDNHIKKELHGLSEDITDLKLKIEYAKMRISFLKRLIDMKLELIKYEGEQ